MFSGKRGITMNRKFGSTTIKKDIKVIMLLCFALLVCSSCYDNAKANNSINLTSKSEFQPLKRTDEIKKVIKAKSSLLEQLKSAFYELDNRNPLIDNEFDSRGFLDFTMNIFKDFLETEISYNMSDMDYKEISSGIRVFPVNGGRIFTYTGTPIFFGDSGKSTNSYFQTTKNRKIVPSVLYNNVYRDISEVIQPANDKKLIVIIGSDWNQQGRRAFIDGFYNEEGILKRINILKEYKDMFWCIDAELGTVFHSDDPMTTTYINNTAGRKIEVEAGNEKIKLVFNEKETLYIVDKTLNELDKAIEKYNEERDQKLYLKSFYNIFDSDPAFRENILKLDLEYVPEMVERIKTDGEGSLMLMRAVARIIHSQSLLRLSNSPDQNVQWLDEYERIVKTTPEKISQISIQNKFDTETENELRNMGYFALPYMAEAIDKGYGEKYLPFIERLIHRDLESAVVVLIGPDSITVENKEEEPKKQIDADIKEEEPKKEIDADKKEVSEQLSSQKTDMEYCKEWINNNKKNIEFVKLLID